MASRLALLPSRLVLLVVLSARVRLWLYPLVSGVAAPLAGGERVSVPGDGEYGPGERGPGLGDGDASPSRPCDASLRRNSTKRFEKDWG